MSHRVCSLLLPLALACRPPEDPTASTSSGGLGSADAAAAAAALEELRQASARPVQVYPSRGTPGTVSLDVPLPAGADPIDSAYTFIETYADLYGFDAPRDELWPQAAEATEGEHFRFVQRTPPEQGGLPVFNSDFTVHVAEGRVFALPMGPATSEPGLACSMG